MNIESILVLVNEELNGFDVTCFPSEGGHFTLSQKDFIEQYPHYEQEVQATIIHIFLNTNHNMRNV